MSMSTFGGAGRHSFGKGGGGGGGGGFGRGGGGGGGKGNFGSRGNYTGGGKGSWEGFWDSLGLRSDCRAAQFTSRSLL